MKPLLIYWFWTLVGIAGVIAYREFTYPWYILMWIPIMAGFRISEHYNE